MSRARVAGCRVCRHRPAAIRGTGYCFGCWPGGPVVPPPCLRCGTTTGYYTAGLCGRCHPLAPQRLDSCRDCHAWGATRTRKWLCKGCEGWRAHHGEGICSSCRRMLAVDRGGACRLCRKQRTRMLNRERWPPLSLAEANRHGQQLFLADMFRVGPGPNAKSERRPPAAPGVLVEIRPCAHRQLALFTWSRDLDAGRRHGFPPLPDLGLAWALHVAVSDHAARYGWSTSTVETAQRGIRVLLATQDTPGSAIGESEVLPLSRIGVSARAVLEVLAEVGMLERDREPAIVRWFSAQVAEFPAEMQRELLVWFEVMRSGSSTPPRCRPRADTTTSGQFTFARPALRAWASDHESLREISRDDVLGALPPSGNPRASMLQGLRSIFRVLKGRQLVFVNPTGRLSIPTPERPVPPAVDLGALRALLDSDDTAAAALAALLAFHAIRVGQLRELKLTDLRDGRLHIADQVILLAGPVRVRLSAYLDQRGHRWPETANPHLFVNAQSHGRTSPVGPIWIRKRLGMAPQRIRQDRILDEAHASRGDVRRVCDLFGLSIAGAYRYTATADQLALDAAVSPPDKTS